MSKQAREKKNAYMRNWRSRNKQKVQKYNKEYWEKRMEKEQEEITV